MQLDWPLVGRERELGVIAGLLRDPESGGAVLVGPGGVGKTRLANECLGLAEREGLATARAVATRSSSQITLGALAPLLPVLGDRTINLLVTARDALRQRAGESRLVLFADDAHLLDDASASLILQLAADRELFVLATVRSGEEVSDAITELWKDGHAERLDIKPLAEDQVDRLIAESLGESVEGTTHAELRRISRGNPLALREVILGAQESGSLVRDDDGRWVMHGPMRISERLGDLVEDRLGALDAAEFDAIEFVALGEPVAIDVLEALTLPGAVEAIERKGLVVVREEDDRLEVWLDHPLFGEVLRANVGALRTRNVLRSLADALEGSVVRRPGDVLRLATWRLESGSRADPELFVLAAKQALAAGDIELSCRFGEVAWETRPSVEAGELLSYALCDVGRFIEADDVLSRTAELVETDEDRVAVVGIRSELLFRTGDAEGAIALERAERDNVVDPRWLDVLDAHIGTQLMLMGEVRQAVAQSETLLEHDNPPAGAVITVGTALCYDGRPETALALHEAGYARCMAAREADEFAIQEDAGIQLVGIMQALMQAGRLAEADELLALAWREVAEQRSTISMGWISLQYALQRSAAGRPADALHWGRISADLWRSSGLYGRMRWPQGVVVLSLATLGRADDACLELAQMDALQTPVRFNEASILDARAWALAASGELEDARSVLVEAAALGEEMAQRTCAAVALHSLARLGAPDLAVDGMRRLRADFEGALLHARADHVEALAADDGERLRGVSAAFEEMGSALFAAAAPADAARSLRRAGRARDATSAAGRARQLAERCEGARTPALALAETTTPLTRREREVALLAAQGLSSKAVAEKLYLSVRTVDNHLSRAYEKLGVAGRDDLKGVIDRLQ